MEIAKLRAMRVLWAQVVRACGGSDEASKIHLHAMGGKFNKTYLGINWWATRRWKFGFGWGHTWLDRFGKTGVTDSFQTRIQWIY